MESLIDIEDFPGRSDHHHPDHYDHYDGDHIPDDAVMTMTRLRMIIVMTMKSSMDVCICYADDDHDAHHHDIGKESVLLNSLLNFNIPMG